jgi:hypothetical protein
MCASRQRFSITPWRARTMTCRSRQGVAGTYLPPQGGFVSPLADRNNARRADDVCIVCCGGARTVLVTAD